MKERFKSSDARPLSCDEQQAFILDCKTSQFWWGKVQAVFWSSSEVLSGLLLLFLLVVEDDSLTDPRNIEARRGTALVFPRRISILIIAALLMYEGFTSRNGFMPHARASVTSRKAKIAVVLMICAMFHFVGCYLAESGGTPEVAVVLPLLLPLADLYCQQLHDKALNDINVLATLQYKHEKV